ncbi:hypothetical protein EHQ24_05900 [Leptospira noumeaensis]|uniref:Peroxiredoxin n=1 Tax=Leptospira noumeaensis TaxID=2484964 RepID=A0A4R9IFR4_9LEPT|nr:hypothetical protein [Leptospira noumeaensis]TGK87123.1 hypothetical protein EHQ24_05900 [Leptospira noumeaensis]
MKVYLGDEPVELTGKRPKNGFKWKEDFQFAPVLNTNSKFPNLRIRKGIFLISTLPNVKSFACSTQVLELEEEIIKRKISAKIIHLASDGITSWEEIKKLHPHLKAHGYSLKNCNEKEINTLKTMLGIGVIGSHRLAHGLFAIQDGILISSLIPKQQYGVPDIKKFLNQLQDKKKLR